LPCQHTGILRGILSRAALCARDCLDLAIRWNYCLPEARPRILCLESLRPLWLIQFAPPRPCLADYPGNSNLQPAPGRETLPSPHHRRNSLPATGKYNYDQGPPDQGKTCQRNGHQEYKAHQVLVLKAESIPAPGGLILRGLSGPEASLALSCNPHSERADKFLSHPRSMRAFSGFWVKKIFLKVADKKG
jgi:hypothetical protein